MSRALRRAEEAVESIEPKTSPAATHEVCRDPVTRDEWYAIAALPECSDTPGRATRLLGSPIVYGVDRDRPFARATAEHNQRELPVRSDYGYLWTTIGQPRRPVFAIPETEEPDRRVFNAATIGVH